jgi:hypothetical protein
MLLKKIIRVILKVLNDSEINELIRRFLQSLTVEEKKEVKNELDEVEESNNSEAR